jgi:hypothetical protein
MGKIATFSVISALAGMFTPNLAQAQITGAYILSVKQTATGFEGTGGFERWGHLCSASWNLSRSDVNPPKPAP